jgi:Ca-activated chloride channel family protein
MVGWVDVSAALQVARTWLAQPEALWLLSVFPALTVLAIVAAVRRRRALRQLGVGLALHALALSRRRGNALRGLLVFLALVATALAVAGPRWGIDLTQQAASGRDLVVVLDVSRSMVAEQPSRQERARRALTDLADSLLRRGGHRVGLVVFAGRAKLVCPLTPDYDHFREAVLAYDADELPADLLPEGEGSSGTRIGAAIKMALAAMEPGRDGLQEILLVSDGDDPGGDDEWVGGAVTARAVGVPVHCLGVGDPREAVTIPTAAGPLEQGGKPVRTRLEERPLKEIAGRTGGDYFPLPGQNLARGALYRALFEGRASGGPRDVDLPLLHPRYPWFFAAALTLLAGNLLLGAPARRRPPDPEPKARTQGGAA